MDILSAVIEETELTGRVAAIVSTDVSSPCSIGFRFVVVHAPGRLCQTAGATIDSIVRNGVASFVGVLITEIERAAIVASQGNVGQQIVGYQDIVLDRVCSAILGH